MADNPNSCAVQAAAPVKRRKRFVTEETRERLRALLAANREKAIAARKRNAKRKRELKQMAWDEHLQTKEARLQAWRASKDCSEAGGDAAPHDEANDVAAAAGPAHSPVGLAVAAPLAALPPFIDFEAMARYVDAYRDNERRQQYLQGRRAYYYQHRDRYLKQAKARYRKRKLDTNTKDA